MPIQETGFTCIRMYAIIAVVKQKNKSKNKNQRKADDYAL